MGNFLVYAWKDRIAHIPSAFALFTFQFKECETKQGGRNRIQKADYTQAGKEAGQEEKQREADDSKMRNNFVSSEAFFHHYWYISPLLAPD